MSVLRRRLALFVALTALAPSLAGCATAAKDAAQPPDGAKPPALSKPSAFEAWSSRSGTGAFFKAVGPAGGSGVRTGWPE